MEEEKERKHQLLKRKSYGELIVEAQRAGRAAAEKAARTALVTKAKKTDAVPVKLPKSKAPKAAGAAGRRGSKDPAPAPPDSTRAGQDSSRRGSRRGSVIERGLEAIKTSLPKSRENSKSLVRAISRRASTTLTRSFSRGDSRRGDERRSSYQGDDDIVYSPSKDEAAVDYSPSRNEMAA